MIITQDTVPKESFLGRYMAYMHDQETPTVYDFMCGCWALSIALGRDLHVNRPKAPVRFNMYLILVSESGVTRKSTSVRMATDLVRDYISRTSSRLSLVESKMTAGLLQYELYEATRKYGYSHVAISASELAAVFQRSGGSHAMPALLTDLYDCPDARIGGGNVMLIGKEVSMRNVYVSFIAASTPTWLERSVTPSIIQGGFTSRCYFVEGNSRKRSIAWPEERNSNAEREELLRELEGIAGRAKVIEGGRIDVSPSGIQSFRNWYETRLLHKDDFRASFEAREDAHVLRFAGYLCINDGRWFIDANDIRSAIKIVSSIKADGARLFSAANLERKDVKLVDKIRAILISAGAGGISQTDILLNCRPAYKSNQIRSVLSVMHELDLAQKFTIEGAGRPTTLWRGTTYLTNPELYSEVAEKLGMN